MRARRSFVSCWISASIWRFSSAFFADSASNAWLWTRSYVSSARSRRIASSITLFSGTPAASSASRIELFRISAGAVRIRSLCSMSAIFKIE